MRVSIALHDFTKRGGKREKRKAKSEKSKRETGSLEEEKRGREKVNRKNIYLGERK